MDDGVCVIGLLQPQTAWRQCRGRVAAPGTCVPYAEALDLVGAGLCCKCTGVMQRVRRCGKSLAQVWCGMCTGAAASAKGLQPGGGTHLLGWAVVTVSDWWRTGRRREKQQPFKTFSQSPEVVEGLMCCAVFSTCDPVVLSRPSALLARTLPVYCICIICA